MAWNKYRYEVGQKEQDDKNEIRLDEVAIRMNFRKKKRIFNAIKGFNDQNVTAKKWLKTMFSRLQKANYEQAFSRWKHFNDGETTIQMMEEVQSLKIQREELKQ